MKTLTSIFMIIVIGFFMISESYNNNILRAENCTVQEVDEVEYEKYITSLIKREEKIEKNNTRRIVTATVYNPVESQCDSDPLITADNSKICLKTLNSGNLRWIAVSRDLRKHYKYGSKVYIESKSNPEINGVWEVHDTMHPRYKNHIDLLMPETIKLGKWYDVVITSINEEKEKEA